MVFVFVLSGEDLYSVIPSEAAASRDQVRGPLRSDLRRSGQCLSRKTSDASRELIKSVFEDLWMALGIRAREPKLLVAPRVNLEPRIALPYHFA